MIIDTEYIFCIDTDSYAGNFERPMCAYMTGVIGECDVGEERAREYEKSGLLPLNEPPEDSDLCELVAQKPDDHGCHRPVSIQPSPGWFNDGMGGHFRDGHFDEQEVLDGLSEKYLEQAEHVQKVYADPTSDYVQERVKQWKDRAANPKLVRYPAYYSVGIWLNRRPTEEEISLLKERAIAFSKTKERWREPFTVEGFRIVEQKTVQSSEVV